MPRNPMDRLDPRTFYFHFCNLEFANGRNRSYLCFQVEREENGSLVLIDTGVFVNQLGLSNLGGKSIFRKFRLMYAFSGPGAQGNPRSWVQKATRPGGCRKTLSASPFFSFLLHRNTKNGLKEDVFKQQFGNQPRVTKPYRRRKTYLCYQLKELDGSTIDKDYFQNKKKRHAEIRFIDKIKSLGLDRVQSYEITCYITWSPCPTCALELVAFTRDYPRLSLQIFASRLYFHWRRWSIQGLQQLQTSVPVAVMRYPEFADCWENFVDHRGEPFEGWDKLREYSESIDRRLQKILRVRSCPGCRPRASLSCTPPSQLLAPS
ncbi:hypothetical protein HPG69_017655, partial [Diceros bicornis minor]